MEPVIKSKKNDYVPQLTITELEHIFTNVDLFEKLVFILRSTDKTGEYRVSEKDAVEYLRKTYKEVNLGKTAN